MEKATRLSFLAAFCLWAFFFMASVAAVAAYYDPANGIHYRSRVGLDIVSAGFRFAGSEAFRQAFTVREWVLTACAATGLVVFVLTWNKQKSAVRCAVFAGHLLALSWGWLGLLMVPYAVLEGIDGEWLGEHSPTFIAAGLWLLVALAMVATSWDRGWFRRLGTASRSSG